MLPRIPAFRFTGVIPLLWPRFLIPRLTLSSAKAVRSRMDCMHEPPVQSDCCACSGNYRLESNPERHDKAPLAAATGNWNYTREIFREVLKLSPNFGYTGRTVLVSAVSYTQLPWLEDLPGSSNRRRTAERRFFRLQSRRLRGDTNDLKRIFKDTPKNESTSMHLTLPYLFWIFEAHYGVVCRNPIKFRHQS